MGFSPVRLGAFVFAASALAALPGCSPSHHALVRTPGPAITPGGLTGEAAPTLTNHQTARIRLSNGATINVHGIGPVTVFPVEGALSDKAFLALQASLAGKTAAEKKAAMSAEMKSIFSQLRQAGAMPIHENDEMGYFTAYMPYQRELFAGLKGMSFSEEILINPIATNPNELKEAKAFTPKSLGLTARSGAAGLGEGIGTAQFSGLERVHAPEFVAQAQKDIGGGAVVDGSSVTVGITDTGITYNHPTFLADDLKTVRIAYMKDYTNEAAVYINPKATFKVAPVAGGTDADLMLSAQVILTPKLPELPQADELTEVDSIPIKVSPELRKALLDPVTGPKARLGVLLEDSYNGDEDQVDLNANGKIDDKFPVIVFLGDTPEQDTIYFDPSATGDFTSAKPLQDWNTSHTMIDVVAERFGFHVRAAKLPASDGSMVDVHAASIVGFDPGNHGSHVSGIAAGRKTISNDSENTLARGVAPEATIVLNRVCANNGGCDATDALVDLATNAGAEVINMSLGGLSPFNDGYGVQETIINRVTMMKNVQFMIAAGNEGPGRQTIGSPSLARLALSIGATANKGMIERQYMWPGLGASPTSMGENPDNLDFSLFFSSVGPTANGGFKPNISAPGTELSSVELNTAPGFHPGLDVYWGTSMATPTATGSYALLLDGIKKYNKAHPSSPLPADALTLQKVLIESARAFDMNSYDPQTGKKTKGQNTWINEGTGMIDLLAAWQKLKEISAPNAEPVAAVTDNGAPVSLDYEVLTSAKSPNGLVYDGSRQEGQNTPAFAAGLYLDADGKDTLRTVVIRRGLPDNLTAGDHSGALIRQLETTEDEFALKTVYYGSDIAWLKAGVTDQLDCDNTQTQTQTQNPIVLSTGTAIDIDPKTGAGTLDPVPGSGVNICIDRAAMKTQLAPGDHGALIYAYRTKNGITSKLASFVIPVYVTIPQQRLANSTAYEVHHTVPSFGVDRNYVNIPAGTSVVKVTLSVDAAKLNASGSAPADGQCSAVELMALLGNNGDTPFASRSAARAYNCTGTGAPAPASKQSISFSRTNPTAGIWDLHLFGSYQYASSAYTMRVDYATGKLSADKITGTVTALNGKLDWEVSDASMSAQPDPSQSVFELTGLNNIAHSQVANGGFVYVLNPLGTLRTYPAGTQSVTITLGGSPGNDIDLFVVGCPAGVATPDDGSCSVVGLSDGPTDVESVTFVPQAGQVYAARVQGSTVKDAGNFISAETITLGNEPGTLAISGNAPDYSVNYSFGADALATSTLLSHPLFAPNKYSVVGDLTLRMADNSTLISIPVTITR